MSKIVDYLNRPMYINLVNFCKEYINLSEMYWNMANKNFLESINKAYENVLIDKSAGKRDYPLVKQTYGEIASYFHQERIKLYAKIPERLANVIQEKINEFISKNREYARKLGLNIPIKNNLTTYQYYYNYEMIKQILPTLESKLWIRKK